MAAEDVRRQFVDAIARHDARSAEQVVTAAIGRGMAVRDAYLGVIQPALHEVGRRWERGELSVAQEHLATAAVQSLIARLSNDLIAAELNSTRSAGDRGRALVACTPGELHAVGARFVADFLESNGWEVTTLGPSTPTAAVLDTVAALQPAVVALSTTMPGNLPSARAVLTALYTLEPRPVIIVGGSAYRGTEALALELGADAYAPDAGGVCELLRER